MDFHSLARRELQALCKKNKIPANMTNVAMADALKALDHVEGLSDNPDSILGTPKRLEILSPDLPRTTRRTSTRQKPVAETETIKKTNVSEPSDTPVTRNGRRRAASTLVPSKIETHTKEDNEEGEQGRRKEDTVVSVHSVRRSARISRSIQKKGSGRAEAVKITVLSEEEAEDLDKEKSMEGSEISALEEDKEIEHMTSDEVLNNRSETSVGEESSVVDSSDTVPLESSLTEEICKPTIEETDKSMTDNDVNVTEPLAAEIQGCGSLVTEEKEKELHGLSESEAVEDKDGATLVPENMSPGKICNLPCKESAAETSSPKGSNPSPNKKSGEDVAVEESGVTSDCESTEDQIYEIQPLQTICLNFCPTENPECNCGSTVAAIDEFVGEVIVEVLSQAEEISYPSPEKTSEHRFQPLETMSLRLGSTENPATVGCKECDQSSDQQQKMNDVPELENVAYPVPTEVLAMENHSIDISKECFNEIEENVTQMRSGNGSEEVGDQLVDPDIADRVAELVYSSSANIREEEKYYEEEESDFDIAVFCSDEDPTDFHFENEEPGTDINAVTNTDKSKRRTVSSFSSIVHEENSHVTTADVTAATAVVHEVHSMQEIFTSLEDILLPNDRNDDSKSGSGDAINSSLHLEGKISLPSPAINAISTPTPKKSLNKSQTPRISTNKKQSTPIRLVFEDNKENTYEISTEKRGLSNGSPVTALLNDNGYSTLHLEDKIPLPSPANNAIPTPTPRKSLKKSQTPGKSGNKKQNSLVQLMVFSDNKENTNDISAKKLNMSIASPDTTARVDMEKMKDVANLPKGYENTSKRQLIKMIKEKEKQLENKRKALQILNKY